MDAICRANLLQSLEHGVVLEVQFKEIGAVSFSEGTLTRNTAGVDGPGYDFDYGAGCVGFYRDGTPQDVGDNAECFSITWPAEVASCRSSIARVADSATASYIDSGVKFSYVQENADSDVDWELQATHQCLSNIYFNGRLNEVDGMIYFDGFSPKTKDPDSALPFKLDGIVLVGSLASITTTTSPNNQKRTSSVVAMIRGDSSEGTYVLNPLGGVHHRGQLSLKLHKTTDITKDSYIAPAVAVETAKLALQVFHKSLFESDRPSAVSRQEVLRRRAAIAAEQQEKKRAIELVASAHAQKVLASKRPKKEPQKADRTEKPGTLTVHDSSDDDAETGDAKVLLLPAHKTTVTQLRKLNKKQCTGALVALGFAPSSLDDDNRKTMTEKLIAYYHPVPSQEGETDAAGESYDNRNDDWEASSEKVPCSHGNDGGGFRGDKFEFNGGKGRAASSTPGVDLSAIASVRQGYPGHGGPSSAAAVLGKREFDARARDDGKSSTSSYNWDNAEPIAGVYGKGYYSSSAFGKGSGWGTGGCGTGIRGQGDSWGKGGLTSGIQDIDYYSSSSARGNGGGWGNGDRGFRTCDKDDFSDSTHDTGDGWGKGGGWGKGDSWGKGDGWCKDGGWGKGDGWGKGGSLGKGDSWGKGDGWGKADGWGKGDVGTGGVHGKGDGWERALFRSAGCRGMGGNWGEVPSQSAFDSWSTGEYGADNDADSTQPWYGGSSYREKGSSWGKGKGEHCSNQGGPGGYWHRRGGKGASPAQSWGNAGQFDGQYPSTGNQQTPKAVINFF